MNAPSWNRRQWLGGVSALAGLSPLLASPIPRAKRNESLLLPLEEELLLIPSGVFRQLASRQMRMRSSIHGLRYSSTGKSLVVAEGRCLLVFNTAEGQLRYRLRYPEDDLNEGAIHDDGMTLFLKVEKGPQREACKLRHYRYADGMMSSEQTLQTNKTRGAVLNSDASYFAQAVDGTLLMLDAKTGKKLWQISTASESIAFTNDGKSLLAAQGEYLAVIDCQSGKTLKKLAAPRGGTISGRPVGSPDQRWVAAIADRNEERIAIWDSQTGKLVQQVRSEGQPKGFSRDGEQLYTENPIGCVVWDVRSGQRVREIDLNNPNGLNLSPDCTQFVTYQKNAIWFYDATTGKPLPFSASPPGAPDELHFINSETLQATLSHWGGWVRWNIFTGKSELFRLPRSGPLNLHGLSRDGREVLTFQEKKRELTLRRIADGSNLQQIPWPESASSEPVATPEGDQVLLHSGEGLALIRTRTKPNSTLHSIKGTKSLTPHGAAKGSLSISHDGNWASAWSSIDDNQYLLSIFDLKGNKLLSEHRLGLTPQKVVLAPRSPRVALHFSEYGNGRDQALRGKIILLNGHRPQDQIVLPKKVANSTSAMAFSPDANTLAYTVNGTIHFIETNTGQLRRTLKIDNECYAMTFSPEGRILAMATLTGPVWLYDLLGDKTFTRSAPTIAECEKAWATLLNGDGPSISDAIQLFARFPDQSLPLLKQKFPRATPENLDRVRLLVRQLSDRSYSIREKANRELEGLAPGIHAELQRAYDQTDSEECRQRLRELLNLQRAYTPAELQMIRVIEAVEWSGTAAAKELLQQWASPDYPRPLRSEAEEALARWQHR